MSKINSPYTDAPCNILTLITDAMSHEHMVEGGADASDIMKRPILIRSVDKEWVVLSIYTHETKVVIDIGPANEDSRLC